MRSRETALLLASSSPRRRELLSRLGIDVRETSPTVDERRLPGEAGPTYALRLARTKAEAPSTELPVIAADTVVMLDDRVLGKPGSADDARRFLAALRGRPHVVVTAVALRHRGTVATHLESARVTFASFSDAILEWYVATGEGVDKAGAYALQGQGALLVERVEGNVQAVVGLPLAPLPGLFARVGLELARDGSRLRLMA